MPRRPCLHDKSQVFQLRTLYPTNKRKRVSVDDRCGRPAFSMHFDEKSQTGRAQMYKLSSKGKPNQIHDLFAPSLKKKVVRNVTVYVTG